MKAFIDAEIVSRCGQLYQQTPSFDRYRHGKQKTGYVIINGQKHQMKKPRIVKRGNSKQEVTIEAYRDFQKNAVIEASVLAKMLHGVSTRNYEAVIEAVQDAYGVRRSSVSRHFVRASAKALKNFNERLQLMKRHLPYHESDHVLNIAYNIIWGQESGEP